MNSTHCFLRTENRSVIELYGSEFLISHTFQHKSIARTGNFLDVYAIGPFSRKRFHLASTGSYIFTSPHTTGQCTHAHRS